MNFFSFVTTHSKQLVYILSILLPSVLTGNIYSSINQKETTTLTLSNLRGLSASMFSKIKQSDDYLSYILNLLLQHEAFLNLDIPAISKLMGEFLFHNSGISNAYIINTNREILYGLNDTPLINLPDVSHIDKALNGQPSYSSFFSKSNYHLQLSIPIFTTASPTIPEAALILTYDFRPFHDLLESINNTSGNIQAFLFNEDGRLIASSTGESGIPVGTTLDLNKIALTLDYNPETPFTLFDDTQFNGIYYTLDSQWTLLVAAPHDSGVKIEDLIAWILGILGVGGATTASTLTKKTASDIASGDIES